MGAKGGTLSNMTTEQALHLASDLNLAATIGHDEGAERNTKTLQFLADNPDVDPTPYMQVLEEAPSDKPTTPSGPLPKAL